MRHFWAAWIGIVFIFTSPAVGDVVVIANRTKESVTFRTQPEDRTENTHTVPSGDLISIPVTGPLKLRYGPKSAEQRLLIDPNSVCFFYRSDDGALEMNRIGFAAEKPKAEADLQIVKSSKEEKPDPFASNICTIPVKILVDDEEPFVQKLWEKRLRGRLRDASDILEKYCRVRFEVVAVDTWDSKNGETQFPKMLAEFEREVRVKPAALAIGFTSQKLVLEQRTRLGGTFAPLRNYILIREWSKNMGDAERLEVLLHELGHYLGATHSPESSSVMRPELNDGKANLRSFRLGYDPVNTLIMCLVGEEIRDHQVRELKDLTPETRKKLESIYREIAKITPDEPATIRLLELVADPQAKTAKPNSAAGK